MGAAEVISFEEVRARKQWDALRGQLHTRFDQWLDGLEAQLQEPAPTLAQVTETMWNLRQELTGGLTETIVEHAHRGESNPYASSEEAQELETPSKLKVCSS